MFARATCFSGSIRLADAVVRSTMDQPNDDLAAAKTPPTPLNTSLDSTQNTLPSGQLPLNVGSVQGVTDHVLDFLSTSSNEALLGVFVLLALLTYLIMGRIGLLLIGVALGIIMHASWEGLHTHDEGGLHLSKRRKVLALELSKRLLEWPKPSAQGANITDHDTALVGSENLSARDLDYDAFQPATGAALRLLTDAVIRDYVKYHSKLLLFFCNPPANRVYRYWYDPILPKESIFPNSCRRTLTHFIIAISSHISRKRTEDTFLQFLTNSSSIIIVFLNELAAAFAATGVSATETHTIIDRYLESAPDSSLANILSEEEQRKKLNMIADDILSNFLDPKAYSCSPVRDFLRETFAGLVLESTVISLSRPEFINDWIVYLLQDGESEIMHAIDAGVEGARSQGIGTSNVPDNIKKIPFELKGEKPGESVILEQPSTQNDQAMDEALLEAKRLSAIMSREKSQSNSERLPNHADPQELHRLSESTHEGSMQPRTAISVLGPMVEDRMASSDPPEPGSPPMSPGLEGTPKLSPQGDASLPPVSLHNARVMVDDDGAGIERGTVKSRPTWDYLLQIEPASTRSTGWMVFRKYSDFLSLHEMLETVSRLNRLQSFSEQFPTLPSWKGKTRQSLARDLESYLQQAMKHESLAETDRMRRFLEKEGGPSEITTAKPVFSFPSQSAFENMGKGVLGALTNAPKGMAGGGRAVFEGVTGVFGGAGHSRKPTNTPERQTQHRTNASHSKVESTKSEWTHDLARDRSSSALAQSPTLVSRKSEGDDPSALSATPVSFAESARDEISDLPSLSNRSSGAYVTVNGQDAWASESTLTTSEDRKSIESNVRAEDTTDAEHHAPASPESQPEIESVSDSGPVMRRQRQPITADETQIAVELIFAVINELYTLSSAWNIRRTLLNAAKTYILRPGSPTLETIRELLQDSMIESHTSDEALGEYVRKLRENALPTEAELKAWPPSPSDQEKAQLRDTARRLFVQRGIPQALTSVMGQAASREALEKIFDSLQVESVARGFVFSVLLQGLRVLTL